MYVPSEELQPEKYCHHLLFMYYPFRNENGLLLNDSYCDKLLVPDVLSTVVENRKIFEPDGREIDLALSHVTTSCSENSTTHEGAGAADVENMSEDLSEDILFGVQAGTSLTPVPLMSDDELRIMIQLLNKSQQNIFDETYSWARNRVKHCLAGNLLKQHPVRLFITGGAGCGKSHLIRTIYHAWTKILNVASSAVDKVKVVLIAPTGVAAINIQGTTINSALCIPPTNSLNLPKLSCEKNVYYEISTQN